MITLQDLFDPADLETAITDGYVRVQSHPTLPLRIYNYSERTVVNRAWNEVTLTCRGLVADTSGGVVARPPRKFFNYGEPEAGAIDLSEPVVVTDKVDGSLGVLVPVDGGHIVATRGSFASEQAIHATQVWNERYANAWQPPTEMTALFEIVYRANRIVLDYGDMDDLVLLGFVDIETGRTHSPTETHGWPGPVAEVFPYRSFAEALESKPTEGVEGFVVHFQDSDARLKLKTEWYLALHRIVTGLNARVVWEHLRDGKPLADLLEPLPDEFHGWVRDVADHLNEQVFQATQEIEQAYADVVASLPEGFTRKDYALKAKSHRNSSALFMRLDGRDYAPLLWRQIDPGAEWRPTNTPTEEAA